jgi:glycerol-3-phosphate acyltransferase PlsY
MSPVEVFVRLAAAALAGYLLGSTPSGVLVGRLFGNVDPRMHGSGKTGATNVLRTLGPGPALLVVTMDAAKGAIAILLARFVFMPAGPDISVALQGWAEACAGFAALLGHNYSLFLKFTGGRGVATGAGTMLAISPFVFLVAIIAFIVPIATTRYVSLGSILACAAAGITDIVLAVLGLDSPQHAIYIAAGAAFIIWSHHDNIQRLLSGTERKFSLSH